VPLKRNVQAEGSENKMRRIPNVLAFVFSALVFGSPAGSNAQTFSNFTLPGGPPGFELIGTSASGSQDIVVGYNPKEISVDKSVPWGHGPGGSSGPTSPTLDLTDPKIPVLGNPSTSLNFGIFFGMLLPDPGTAGSATAGPPGIQFNLNDATGRPIVPVSGGANSFNYGFSASDGTNIFDIFFTVTGASPLDPLSWGMSVPGPPDLPAVQFNFSFQAPGDPTLSFSVFENGQQLEFSAAVPEPETYAMLLAGLGLLVFAARRGKKIPA
jgi:hypothetical protein